MWRTFCLLSLMLSTFDFPRDRLLLPVRVNAELATRDDGPRHRKEARGETETELVGKWRNNGEALEPKWRDGDTIPLLPFSQFSRYSDPGEEDDNDDEDDDYDDPRAVKRRRKIAASEKRRENSLRSRKNPAPAGERSKAERRGNGEERERNRGWTSENAASFKETFQGNGKKVEPSRDSKEESASTKYREAFQARPNDYEHEFADDEYLKPRPRKRRPPQNDEFALAKSENESSSPRATDGDNFDDEPWLREDRKKSAQLLSTAMQLKSLLKMQQDHGLSLSELLQRRNLTLSDLLKGKADALDALRTTNAEESDGYEEAVAKIQTTRKPQENSTQAQTARESEQRQAISSSALRDSHAKASSRSSDSETANATTTAGKSIPAADFAASRGKTAPIANSTEVRRADEAAAKSRNGDQVESSANEGLDEDEIMEFSDFTDYAKRGRSGPTPVWLVVKEQHLGQDFKDKGSTLSIEKILSPTERSKSTSSCEKPKDSQATTIEEEASAADRSEASEKEYQNDQAYYDFARERDEDEARESEFGDVSFALANNNLTAPSNRSDREENKAGDKKSYDEIVSRAEPEARAEIFELFASGSAAKRLERLLKSRNMSLEELIALRQRGSSKVHLAEVSRIRAPKSNEHDFGKNSSTMANYDNYSTTTESLADPRGLRLENVPEIEETASKSNRAVEIVDLLTTFGSLPFARDFQREFARQYSDSRDAGKSIDDASNAVESDSAKQRSTSVDVRTIYGEDENENENETKEKTLSKVKASIIASGAILGLTMLVFLAIFIACRIRQKRKYRYRSTFSRAVFQGPVMAARKLSNSSSLSTVMVNVVATSTAKRPEKNESQQQKQQPIGEMIECKSDIDNDSLDANDSWETIPDYMK